MTLSVVMAVTLRYFTEFGKPALQKTICGGIYARVYCIFSACTICRRKESSRSLSHLLMSFLLTLVYMCCASLLSGAESTVAVARLPEFADICF